MTYQDIADRQWYDFLSELKQTHSRTESQIESKRPTYHAPITSSKPIEYTDEDREQFSNERFMQEADNQNTLYRT